MFSKIPLPNYRFDLDDKRPLREVISPPPGLIQEPYSFLLLSLKSINIQLNLHTDLLQRLDAYLREYLTKKSKRMDRFPANSVSRTRSTTSIPTDEGFLEQPESMAATKTTLDKILWQRSLQLRDRQEYWEVRYSHLFVYITPLIFKLLFSPYAFSLSF